MRQVLDSSDLHIDRKTYYNLIRSKPLEDGISNDSFEGLVLALEEVGFRFAYLISNKLADNTNIKRRILKQLFFISNQQAIYRKRFLLNQVFLIDSTFETNRLGLILLIVVRIINTN